MRIDRRDAIAMLGAGAVAAMLPGCGSLEHTLDGDTKMHGLIGRMKVVPGQRDAMVAILLEGISRMPGCLSYVVAHDPGDADAIWITEVWDSADSHKASLSLPSVRDAIARAKPLIASFGEHFETVPVGGHGLGAA